MTYDYIVAGAGAAGLSLVWFILSKPSLRDKSILIVDKSLQPVDDKTWCFWDDTLLPSREVIHHTWNSLHIAALDHNRIHNLNEYRYYSIRSGTYRNWMFDYFKSFTNVRLVEAAVLNLSETATNGIVETSAGTFTAGTVFQSLPVHPTSEKKSRFNLKQHFIGFEIEARHRIFDTHCATLMDFNTDQRGVVTFMYVLPYTSTYALVEYTVFSDAFLPEKDYMDSIEAYVHARYGLSASDYSVQRIEKGAIPMTETVLRPPPFRRIHTIGAASGITKPSTGYTFTRILEQCSQLAASLENGSIAREVPVKRRFQWYDRILLGILSEQPALAAGIFEALFKHNSMDDILRFLDEKSSIKTETKLFWYLPWMPFLRSLFRNFSMVIAR